MLPGEAVLTVCFPLIHRQHVRVSRAGEHQLPSREVPHRLQAPAAARAQEPLRPLYTFVHVVFSVYCSPVRCHRPPPVSAGCSSSALSPGFFSGPLGVRAALSAPCRRGDLTDCYWCALL